VLGIGLTVFIMMNCQFGVVLFLWLFLHLLVFYFLIALLSSTLLVAENDLCANMEEIILQEVTPSSILIRQSGCRIITRSSTPFCGITSRMMEFFGMF